MVDSAEIQKAIAAYEEQKRAAQREKRKRVPRDLIRTLNRVQVDKLIDTARQVGLREHALVLLGYHLGLRAGEYGRIRLTDVELASQDHAPHGEVRVTAEKDSVSQTQVLEADVLDALKAWIADHPGGPWLFPAEFDTARGIHRGVVHAMFVALFARAGLPRRAAYPHILKATLASRLLSEGADLKFVQYWLRHKSLNSTMRYLHLTEEQRTRGLGAVARLRRSPE